MAKPGEHEKQLKAMRLAALKPAKEVVPHTGLVPSNDKTTPPAKGIAQTDAPSEPGAGLAEGVPSPTPTATEVFLDDARPPAQYYAPKGQCEFCDRRRGAAKKGMRALAKRKKAERS